MTPNGENNTMALKEELRTQGDFLFKHRSYLPLVIIVVGIYVYVQNVLNSTITDSQQDDLFKLGCFLVCVLGLVIRMVAIGYSADNTSGRNTTVGQVADSVNSTGLYATVRHPLYVGNFFMWLGIAGFTQEPWFIVAFVFMYWVYYERIMYAEEMFLIDKYGKEYVDWAAKTPAFIPAFSKWIKPKYTFSWRKIIRQEKAGILNMFLVVFAFEVIGASVANRAFSLGNVYWMYGFAASVAWYIIIKTIQKTTQVLSFDR